MRRIITWLSATAVLVAVLIGYQLAVAGTRSGDDGGGGSGDKGRACPATTTATATDPAATHCEPPGADRTGKPGENK